MNRYGRRPRTVQYNQARDVLMQSARDAANYLCGCFTVQRHGYEVGKPSPTRIKAAMYCLDQVLGKPVMRVEGVDGATVTYNQIIVQARERARELADGEYPAVMPGESAPGIAERVAGEEHDGEPAGVPRVRAVSRPATGPLLDPKARVIHRGDDDGDGRVSEVLADARLPGHEDAQAGRR